jgi:hypothetical protein
VFEEPNVSIDLSNEVSARGLYGFNKQVNEIVLYVDEPSDFVMLLKQIFSTELRVFAQVFSHSSSRIARNGHLNFKYETLSIWSVRK